VETEGLKVVSVSKDSASFHSGIKANTDWILGTTSGIFFKSHEDLMESVSYAIDSSADSSLNEDEFYSSSKIASAEPPSNELIKDQFSTAVGFMVFDSVSETIREIFIKVDNLQKKIGCTVMRVIVPMQFGSSRNEDLSLAVDSVDDIIPDFQLKQSLSSVNHAIDSQKSTDDSFPESRSDSIETVKTLLSHLSATPKTWNTVSPPKNLHISEWTSPIYISSLDITNEDSNYKPLHLENPAALGTIVSSQAYQSICD